jgi:hypothetical protein
MVVSFAMLLNLASVAHAEDKEALWGFIRRYAPDASPGTHPDLDAAAGFAVRYYNDFVKPTKVFRAPTDQERAAMEELVACLGDADKALDVIARKNAQEGKEAALPAVDWQDDEFLQSIVFAIGKTHGFEPLRAWFSALYEVLMGASQGPRFGGFIALYGIEETKALIADGLRGAVCGLTRAASRLPFPITVKRRALHDEADDPGNRAVGLGLLAQAQEVLRPTPISRPRSRASSTPSSTATWARPGNTPAPISRASSARRRISGAWWQQGYPMVWTPGQVEFIDLQSLGSIIVQRVEVIDQAGTAHYLGYQMIQTENGWRINGVQILRAPQVGA